MLKLQSSFFIESPQLFHLIRFPFNYGIIETDPCLIKINTAMDKHSKPEKKGRSGLLQLKKCDSFMVVVMVMETPVTHLLQTQTRVQVVAEKFH